MNILILNWRDPKHPLAGGAEIALLEHAKYWQKKGATITWLAASYSDAKTIEKDNGIVYIHKGSQYSTHFWTWIMFTQGKLKTFDIVIDCFHFLPFFTPLYINKKKIVALINEVAGRVWFENLPLPLAVIGYILEPLFFIPYKKIPFITASESTKSELKKVGIKNKSITVIHNGIENKIKYKKISRTKSSSLVFLGRISKDKGIEDVLITYKNLIKKYSELQLFIAGKEEHKNLLKNLLHKHKLLDYASIHILGYISEMKKYELLQKAWVLLHASTKEGWGLTVIEANSVGTPVVGYNVAGLKDSIKNNETGLLVNTNAISLASGVEKLLLDKQFYNTLSHNAKKWARQFSWEKSTKESWAMLKERFSV